MLRITIGAPGSGKTTDALAWIMEAPEMRCRMNRDDLRKMMHGIYLGTRSQEEQVTTARDAAILRLLRSGFDVIADDTNLRWQHVERLRRIAARVQVGFEVVSYLHVPLATCIERDSRRSESLGEAKITKMWQNAIRDQIDCWKTSIMAEIPNAEIMIRLAMDDPIAHENGQVVSLARMYTNRRIAQYAPTSNRIGTSFREAA
jgi:predicted kinase